MKPDGGVLTGVMASRISMLSGQSFARGRKVCRGSVSTDRITNAACILLPLPAKSRCLCRQKERGPLFEHGPRK